jgi:DNA-binding NarL/FixJ family response regulator
MTIGLLLVDDQPLLLKGVRMVLDAEEDLRVLGEAPDGLAAVEQAGRLQPDVILMDVRMPRLDGVEATRRIVATGSLSRVLILTTFDLDEYAFAGLRAGAGGFLLKNAPPAELIAGIRAIARGDAVVAPSVTRRLLDAYAQRLPATAETEPGVGLEAHAIAALTRREREILVELGEARSNAEIAARLQLSEATVKTHVAHILRKLDLRDRVQAAILAHRIGLVR